ncbi:hypothetical protein TGMAS_413310 [Toxoplasma gondii MAS]|uniref:Uncharacterized protein n=1 Tax=Toxoplasma gondii MAS TaxID=943118 RepID=A0A086QVR5_TOXGO|nr:hypothetical protein TGMAS_413310 [Toxoplasma gondii MAS]
MASGGTPQGEHNAREGMEKSGKCQMWTSKCSLTKRALGRRRTGASSLPAEQENRFPPCESRERSTRPRLPCSPHLGELPYFPPVASRERVRSTSSSYRREGTGAVLESRREQRPSARDARAQKRRQKTRDSGDAEEEEKEEQGKRRRDKTVSSVSSVLARNKDVALTA